MVMSLVLQVSGHTQKYWGNRNFDLMMEVDETSEDHKSQ